ncbi:MAG: hypothetical protein HY961_19730 [Ignavibacteriae bacterium]|nr:hypothetical protein [Ignavibacteriota bacterium]
MFSDTLVWGLIICFGVMLVVGVACGWFPNHDNTLAPLTAFHDFQPKDKQEAIEVVMEQKAGKKQFEQTTGGLAFPGFEMRTKSELSEEEK